MSLRRKALLGLTVITVLLVGTLVAFHRFFVANQFDEVERQEVRRDAQRALNALEVEQDALDLLLVDWAWWDDTYDLAGSRDRRNGW